MGYLINATQFNKYLHTYLIDFLRGPHTREANKAFIQWGMSQYRGWVIRTYAVPCILRLKRRFKRVPVNLKVVSDTTKPVVRRLETIKSYRVNDKVSACCVWQPAYDLGMFGLRVVKPYVYVTLRKPLYDHLKRVRRDTGSIKYLKFDAVLGCVNHLLSNVYDYWMSTYTSDCHKQYVTAMFPSLVSRSKTWHRQFERAKVGPPGERRLVVETDTYKLWYLKDAQSLYHEGAVMHHCVALMDHSQESGYSFFFRLQLLDTKLRTPDHSLGLTLSYSVNTGINRILITTPTGRSVLPPNDWPLNRIQALGLQNRKPTETELEVLQDVDEKVARYLSRKIEGPSWEQKYTYHDTLVAESFRVNVAGQPTEFESQSTSRIRRQGETCPLPPEIQIPTAQLKRLGLTRDDLKNVI